MIQPDEATSLTDFKRDTNAHLRRLRKTGRPSILTINGKAALVIIDKNAYEKMAAIVEESIVVAGIQRGLDSIARGEGLPARAALQATFAKLNIQHAARKPRRGRGGQR